MRRIRPARLARLGAVDDPARGRRRGPHLLVRCASPPIAHVPRHRSTVPITDSPSSLSLPPPPSEYSVRYAQDSIHTLLSRARGHALRDGDYAQAKEVARQALVRALVRTGDLVHVGLKSSGPGSKTEEELDRVRENWGRRVWTAEDEVRSPPLPLHGTTSDVTIRGLTRPILLLLRCRARSSRSHTYLPRFILRPTPSPCPPSDPTRSPRRPSSSSRHLPPQAGPIPRRIRRPTRPCSGRSHSRRAHLQAARMPAVPSLQALFTRAIADCSTVSSTRARRRRRIVRGRPCRRSVSDRVGP